MKNDSVVKALENLLKRKVYRSSSPELMGAYGCALTAKQNYSGTSTIDLDSLINSTTYSIKQLTCKGCENSCLVSAYTFQNNNTYYSGNRCEKIFNSSGSTHKKGNNIYKYKFERTFKTYHSNVKKQATIGIPRALNMYEDYPFWFTFLTNLGFRVIISEKSNRKTYEKGIESVLSDISSYSNYERSLNQVMSENICFPAKISHSHIDNLINKGIKHIFFPYVVFEKLSSENENNSFNCPIVSSYNVVVKHLKNKYQDIQIDNPVFSFKDTDLLKKNCKKYLTDTFNITSALFEKAFDKALEDYQNRHITKGGNK